MQMRYFVDKEAGELGTFIKRDIEQLFLLEFTPRYERCVRKREKPRETINEFAFVRCSSRERIIQKRVGLYEIEMDQARVSIRLAPPVPEEGPGRMHARDPRGQRADVMTI